MNILGISTTHDAGATLLRDGELVAAVNEERFNRTKHYGYLPFESIQYCLEKGEISSEDLDVVAVPSEVLRTDARLLLDADVETTNISRSKFSLTRRLTRNLTETARQVSERNTKIPQYARQVTFPDGQEVHMVNHHQAHAASAYYTSGHESSLVVTLDGLGDRLSGTVWKAENGELEPLRQWGREGSLGWFYGIVTEALGWWIGNGEGKTMGLASYAEPEPEVKDALREFLPKYEDGELVSGYEFSRPSQWEINDTLHWSFDESEAVGEIVQEYGREKTAAAAQSLLEEEILHIVKPWVEKTDIRNLATAGGVFLNVQVNNRILREIDVEDYFIFPNAGDGGLPTGVALASNRVLQDSFERSRMEHPYYGPDITADAASRLEERQLDYTTPQNIYETVAEMLAEGKLVAWSQGRMEYGPRALGNRSILADPTKADAMDRVNKRVKFRDSWRPFAPSMLAEAADEYLVNPTYDPFMITSFDVRPEKKDEIPAVTHVDRTTRPHMVRKENNEPYWKLLKAFEERTGTPVLLNTSYNLSGDPIVADVVDAIQTFYASGLDALVIGNYLLEK